MKKTFIISILMEIVMLLNYGVYAQSDSVEVEEKIINSIKRYKWEVGADARAIFGWSTSGASLFARQQYVKKTKKPFESKLMANRFRFGISSNWTGRNFDTINVASNNNPPVYVPVYGQYYYSNQPDYARLFFSFGKEQQEQFKKFQLFYGYDLIVDFEIQRENYFYYYYSYNTDHWYTPRMKALGIGFAPLIGMKYFLHSRLAFSLEANWILKYSLQKEYLQQVFTGERIKQQSFGKFSSQTNPMYAFNISFFFK